MLHHLSALKIGCLFLLLLVFAGCGPSAPVMQEEKPTANQASTPALSTEPAAEVVKPVEPTETSRVITVAPAPTQAVPLPTQAPESSQSTAQATHTPASSPPSPGLPTSSIEVRLVELEYPSALRLGDSDILRLALLPWQDGYLVQAEFPEHETITQTIQIDRPGGYELTAIARLDGVGFEISPDGDQTQFLPVGQAISWRWSLSPHAAGQQRLSVNLMLRWTPAGSSPPIDGANAAPRQVTVYSRSMEIRVLSFFGLTRGQALAGGFVGLFFGGGISLAALLGSLGGRRQILRSIAPNPSLAIEPRPGLALTEGERSLLRALFARYARLSLESEFLSGYSADASSGRTEPSVSYSSRYWYSLSSMGLISRNCMSSARSLAIQCAFLR